MAPKQTTGDKAITKRIDATIDDLVANGHVARLSAKEWAAIRDAHDAHGCILVPKDAGTTAS